MADDPHDDDDIDNVRSILRRPPDGVTAPPDAAERMRRAVADLRAEAEDVARRLAEDPTADTGGWRVRRREPEDE